MDITWIYWIAAIAALLIAVRYVLVYRLISNLGCRMPSIERADFDDIPDDAITILGQADRELERLGFHFQCYLKIKAALFQTQGDLAEFGKAFYHPVSHTVSLVTINSFWQLNNPVIVSFSTLYRDGFSIQTTSFLGSFGLPLPENVDLKDSETHDIAKQWKTHTQRIAGDSHGESVNLSTPGLLLKASQIEFEQLMQFWIAQGVFRHRGTSTEGLSLSPKYAMRLSKWMLVAMSRASKKALDLKSIPAPVLKAWDGQIIRLLIAESERKSGWLGKLLLFVGSAVFFAIAFGVVFSWEFVPILIGVLLLHELGHFYAMKWTGYKDLQIFFVPLLGAAVSGSKHDATPLQQLFVYLMGPMPGLLLSIPLLVYGYTSNNELAIAIGMFALIINYLNLLPITPLDGGRVLDALLFTRFPRAQFIFTALSTAALLLAGIYMLDQILLLVGGLLVLSLPSSWTASRIKAELQKIKRQSENPGDAHQLTLDTLLSPGLDSIQRAKRLNTSKQVLHSAQINHATVAVTLAGLIIYVVCLLSPLAVVAGIGVYSLGSDKLLEFSDRLLASNDDFVSEENWQQLLDEADSDEERWHILTMSFYQLVDSSPEIAKQNLDKAIDISFTFDVQNDQILQTWYMLNVEELSEQYKLDRIEKAIEHYRSIAEGSYLLTQLYQLRASLLSDPEQKIDAYQQLISMLGAESAVENPVIFTLRSQLAKVYYQQGQFAETEQLLLRNSEWQIANNQMDSDAVELIWFYRATEQNNAAIKLGNKLLDKLSKLDGEEQHHQRMRILQPMMWIACENAQRTECLEYMDDIVADWKALFEDNKTMAGNRAVPLEHYSCTTRVTAYHLLGDGQQARAIASQFLIQHPNFKAASTEMSSEFFSEDWNRLYEEESEHIQNVYHIAIAYD